MFLFYTNPILIAAAVLPAIFLLVHVYRADKLEKACAAAHLAGALRHCRHLYRARARARGELSARAVVRGGERGV